MKDKILPLLLASSILVGCSSVYKSGQTPDDVYYSPTKEVVKNYEKQEERYQEDMANKDDEYLKMKVRNRYRWSRLDDYDYWNDSRYDYNCHCTCNNYYGYNYYYNPIRYSSWYTPHYPVIYYMNPKVYTGTTGKSNISSFNNRTYNNTNRNYKTGGYTGSSNTSSGSSTIRVVTPSSSGSSGGKSGGYNSKGSNTGSSRQRGN